MQGIQQKEVEQPTTRKVNIIGQQPIKEYNTELNFYTFLQVQ